MNALRPWLLFVLLCISSLTAAIWLREGTPAGVLAYLDSAARDLHGWIAAQHTDVAELPGTRAGPEGPGVTGSNTNRSSTSPGSPVFSPMDHSGDDRAACAHPPTKSRSDVSSQPIFKWTDKDGQTHLSDHRPAGQIASVVDLGNRKQDFTYEIRTDGVSLPLDFQGQLAASSKRIYDTWHFFLGEEKLRQAKINVLLIGGPERFDAYYANVAPGRKKVNGFYRMANNEAVVKFDPANPASTLATTFHEVSHLITAAHLGPTPPWLTEGLAEYFEMMQVQGQGGVISPNRAHIRLLKTNPMPHLSEYLAIKRPEWHGENRDRNYAMAWSITYFLMGDAAGMYALQKVIREAQVHFCKPFSAASSLHNAYPGGINQLESDWRKWLAGGDFQPHQT